MQPLAVIWDDGDSQLTHWGRVTHICVGNLTIIGSDNGLSPERRQAIIWTNAAILLIGPLGTNFSEILIEIQTFSLKKIRLKMASAKCRPFCLGLNVLTTTRRIIFNGNVVNTNMFSTFNQYPRWTYYHWIMVIYMIISRFFNRKD